jgi:hypothetical protein
MFSTCKFVTAPLNGCLVNSGAVRTSFSDCEFVDNCVAATAATGHGLVINTNVDGCSVMGGFCTNAAIGRQGFGIVMGSGVVDITIYGVDVRGNATGGISAGSGSSSDVSIRDCKGARTENYGVGGIANGGSSAVINHGLIGNPQTVQCTMVDGGGGPQASGANIPRVVNVTATQFTFDIGVVATANRNFYWSARY